jgi:flagellar capping protein FliD
VQINGESSQYDTNSPALKTMGFTLTAFEATQATGDPAAPASVKFVYNNLEISTRIQDWVQARNDLTKVIDKYASMDIDSLNLTPEEKKDFQLGLLAHNSALMELDRHIGFSLQKSVGVITAATLGMTSEDGLLVVNAKTLNEKILNDFEGVKKFFTYNETSTNPKFQTTTHPESILTDIITSPLNITVYNAGGTLGAFFQIQGQAGLIQAGEITQVGNTLQIKADPNSTLNGFTFFYDGTLADGAQATTSMQFSQGIGDTSIEFFERAFGEKGLFSQSSSTFEKEIKLQQEKIDRIEKSGQHKLQMLEQRLEAAVKAIAAITSIINQVRAMNQMQYAAAAA